MVPLPLQTRPAATTNTPNRGKAGPNWTCVVTGAAGSPLMGPNEARVVAAANTPNGGKAGPNGGKVGPNGAWFVTGATGRAAGKAGNPLMGPNRAHVTAGNPLMGPNGAHITPRDAAVGKPMVQSSRSLPQPQQLARDLLPLDVFGQLHDGPCMVSQWTAVMTGHRKPS
jgi:hypothetical protein